MPDTKSIKVKLAGIIFNGAILAAIIMGFVIGFFSGNSEWYRWRYYNDNFL